VALGDWGREGGWGQRGLGALLGQWGAATAAVAVVSVGDNFYETGLASAQDRQLNSSWAAVYTHPWFAATPWLLVSGNHDWRGSYLPAGGGVAPAGGGVADARWVYPSLYHSHTFALPGAARGACGVRALFLDTVPLLSEYRNSPDTPAMAAHLREPGADAAAQLAWLAAALANASAERCAATVVVGHHPLYSGGEHGDNGELIAQLEPALDGARVDAYIAGHDHTLEHLLAPPPAPPAAAGALQPPPPAGAVQYIISGAGSRLRVTDSPPRSAALRWFADQHGFTVHSFNATHARHTFVGANGTALHVVTVPLRVAAAAAADAVLR